MLVIVLYTLTIFLSALLLFVVQPMFTRLVLPWLGGSPAVWNTAQVFFQAALLAGALANDPRWRLPQTQPNVPVWTDDFNSLVSVIKWQ